MSIMSAIYYFMLYVNDQTLLPHKYNTDYLKLDCFTLVGQINKYI